MTIPTTTNVNLNQATRIECVVHAKTIARGLTQALSIAMGRSEHNTDLAALLAATIHDGYLALTALAGTAGESQMPAMVRVVFEAYIDFVNCCNDPTYAMTLHYRAEKEAKKLWSHILNSPLR